MCQLLQLPVCQQLQPPPTTSSPLMVPPPPHLPSPSSAAQGVPLQGVPFFLPCPAARALHCPTLPCYPHALQPARCPALQPARRPCSPCAALWQPARRPFAALLALPCLCRPAAAAAASATAAAGAGGAGPTTDRHCLSRQLQRLGVDSGGHCLSQTTPPLSSFTSGFFSEPVQVGEALVFYAAAPDASDSAAALGASESIAALGARESAAALSAHASPATGPSSAEALHNFTLDSGAPRCFFRDCTSLTPLAALVPVSLADPTGGLVVARASTVLPCPAVPTSSLSGLHLPTFSTNLVAEAGQVAASSQVSASCQLAASCSCRVLSHQTLLWHHRLGHPSLPHLCGMHSRLLVFGLPRSLPPLPRSHAPPCLPCVDGQQRVAPHSSEFPPTTAPLQTLHTGRNGIVERRIGLIMEVACTSMIRAAAPHFLWPFAVRYAAHQLNLWPRVFEPETSPTLRWTGKVGDALVFRVWGALSLVRDAKASKLSSRTLCCVFLGFPTDAPPWQFYHPRSRRVFSSQDVAFDESVYYYRLHPHASYPVPLAPLFLVAVPPPVDPVPPQVPAPSAETAGPEPGGAETEGEGSGGAATGGAGSWGAATGGVDSGGRARPSGGGAVGEPTGGPGAGQPPQPDLLEMLSPQTIRAWIVWRGSPGGGGYSPAGAGADSPRGIAPAGGTRGAAGAGGAIATSLGGTAGAGGAGGAACARGTGAGGTGGAGAAGPGGGRNGGAGAAGAGGAVRAGGAGGNAGAGVAGARDTGGTGGAGAAGPGGARTRGTTGARGPGASGASGAAGAGGAGGATGAAGARGAGAAGSGGAGAVGTALCRPFVYPQPQSTLPPPDSVLLQSLTERREPENRASTPVRARRVTRPRPVAVPGTHGMAFRPSSVPHRVVLHEPPASSLLHIPNPESDLACAARPIVTRLLAIVVIDPDLESTAAFALITELVEFAARIRLDYVASLVTESEYVYPPSVGGELALGSDVLEDRQFELECLAATLPRTYVDEVPPHGANIVDDMWIFRVKRPPGSPPTFKAHYVARGFSQRQGIDFFQTFSPTPKMTTLWVLLHVATQRDYELHSLDFCTAFLQGSLHEEIWLRRPPSFSGSFPVLQHFAFQFSSPQPTPLSTGHSLSAPPSDESVEPSGPYLELEGCLMYLMTCTRPDLAYPLSLLARYVAPGRHRKVHWDAAKRVMRYLCCTSRMGLVLGGQGLVELRWLTYLLTDLGERPRSPPVLYVNNNAMLALCHEQRLEHRTKHIALRYFLARELQQRCQLRLSYMASHANTADVFTKALGSGDHQCFCTALGLVPSLPHLLVA
ncbi:unnamed protein product [Closterium sp. NIES-53]